MPPVELLHPWELAHTGRGSPSRGSQEPAVKASSTETRKYGYDRRAKFLSRAPPQDPLTSQSPTQPGHPLRAGQNLSPHCSGSLCHCVWSCPHAAVSPSTMGASGKEGASISPDCPPSVHPRPGTKLAPAGAWGSAENPELSQQVFPLPRENPSSHQTIFSKAAMAR